jgi:hypothetical protein
MDQTIQQLKEDIAILQDKLEKLEAKKIKEQNDLIEKMVQNPPDFLKFQLGKSLEDIAYEWWDNVFVSNNFSGLDVCIDNLIDDIESFLPDEQNSSGSQNSYVDCATEGWNDCLRTIKSKLRNKKSK